MKGSGYPERRSGRQTVKHIAQRLLQARQFIGGQR